MNPDLSWVGVLEHHATRTPDKPIAVFGDDVVTYRQMADRSSALATGLKARGVGVGDVVGLLSYNGVDFLETIFAANHLGAIAMPINWRLAAAEVAFILEHSQARAFVCDDELLDLGEDAADRVDGDLVRVVISTGSHEDWERLADVRVTTDLVARVSAGADDLLGAYSYLAGDGSRWTTGSAIVVDGGYAAP